MRDNDGFGPDDIVASGIASRETVDRINQILGVLDVWRQKLNLIGPAEFDSIWRRHVFDSLQIVPLLTHHKTVVDLGAGSGFPGLVVAAAFVGSDRAVEMIETVGKKCAFLREVIQSCGLPATVAQCRIENAKVRSNDAVTARALAPLNRLLSHAEPWMSKGATGYFFKGQRWEEELTSARECWTFRHEAVANNSGGSGVILKVWEAQRV